jgi:hypothetical protein
MAEVAVPTGQHMGGIYTSHYKMDIANRELMIGIEVDGELTTERGGYWTRRKTIY